MKKKDLLIIIVLGFIISLVLRVGMGDLSLELDLGRKISSNRAKSIIEKEGLKLASYNGNGASYWNVDYLSKKIPLWGLFSEERLIVWISFRKDGRVDNYKIMNEDWVYPELRRNKNVNIFLKNLVCIEEIGEKWVITDGIFTIQKIPRKNQIRFKLQLSTSKKELEVYVDQIKRNNMRLFSNGLK